MDGLSPGRRVPTALFAVPSWLGRPATTSAYIAQIDGLRFLAIAVVLIWHISLRASRYAEYWNHHGERIAGLYPYFPHGEVGVGLFFVISGYIITQPFFSRPREQWNIGNFYWRRLRRIYPPYAIAITACLVLVIASGYHNHRLSSENIYESYISSLAYIHGLVFNSTSTINPPIWSLELEIQFYALIPLVMLAYVGRRAAPLRTRLAIGCIVVAVAIVASSLLDLASPFDGRFRYGIVSHLYLFGVGVLLADYAQSRDPMKAAPSRAFDVVFGFGLAAMFALGLYLTHVDARPGGGWPDILTDVAMLIGVVAAYFGAMRGRFARIVMGNAWLGLIGTMCFSIYLVHIAVVEGVASLMLQRVRLHSAAAVWGVHLLVLIPAALGVSAVFYLCVERPFMTSRRYTSGARRGRSASAEVQRERGAL